jgi:hypothetical protein
MSTRIINKSLIVSLCLICLIGCKAKSALAIKFDVPTNNDIFLYGVDISKIMNSKFYDIEKMLNCKSVIDEELGVIFTDINGNFIRKNIKTDVADYIRISYGPAENSDLYKTYLNVKPTTITFYGSLKDTELLQNKNLILKELQTILRDTDSTKTMINKIRKEIIDNVYTEEIFYDITFITSEFPLAKFYIGFAHGELFYKYVFSKVKEPYP